MPQSLDTSACAPREPETAQLVEALATLLIGRKLRLACAESCTGGLISNLLTNLSGSSAWFQGSAVTYSNEAKEAVLGVPRDTLVAHGAVSEPVVLAMARGASRVFGSEAALAVSGIAGPTGGTPDKPVGTVWMAWLWPGGVEAELFRFSGGRETIKRLTAGAALRGLIRRLGG